MPTNTPTITVIPSPPQPVIVSGYSNDVSGIVGYTISGLTASLTLASSVTVESGGQVGGTGGGGVNLLLAGPIVNDGLIPNYARSEGGSLLNGGTMGSMTFQYAAVSASVTNEAAGHMGKLRVLASTTASASITNQGSMGNILITASSVATGVMTNDGTAGYVDVFRYGVSSASAAVTNAGSLLYGVEVGGNGTVVNGSDTNASAFIGATIGVSSVELYSGRVSNYATMSNSIVITNGGSVANGSPGNDSVALVQGGISVGDKYGTAAQPVTETLVNYGTVLGAAALGSAVTKSATPAGTGVLTNLGRILGGASVIGGTIINGSALHANALIERAAGVAVNAAGTAAPVTNFGTILAMGTTTLALGVGIGVTQADGAVLTNGTSTGLLQAEIDGYSGVGVADKAGAGTVANYATITASGVSSGSFGVELLSGGTVIDGATVGPSSNDAEIDGGYFGVTITGSAGTSGAGTVENYGTITGATEAAIAFDAAGYVDNGSAAFAHQAVVRGGKYGVQASGSLHLINHGGVISSTDDSPNAAGVIMDDGGYVLNGVYKDNVGYGEGQISGFTNGIVSPTQPATISNSGEISEMNTAGAAIELDDGGTVTNGLFLDGGYAGRISGATGVSVSGAAGTVTNLGTIAVGGGVGVLLASAGTVTNGSPGDTTADIVGTVANGNAAGVKFALGYKNETQQSYTGHVTNFGTISGHAGAFLTGGGTVTNGTSLDTDALIGGYYGVNIQETIGTVVNFGGITATGAAAYGFGVLLANGGLVTNGDSASTKATVRAVGSAVTIKSSAGTVQNYGTLTTSDSSKATVYLGAAGTVTNGSTMDALAMIGIGRYGVDIVGSGSVANFGVIVGGAAGVLLEAGGTVMNGLAGHQAPGVSGGIFGVAVKATGSVGNYGTIVATGAASAKYRPAGVYLASGQLSNGNATDKLALIRGYVGVQIGAADATIVNYGTIIGTGATAIGLHDKTDRLVLEGQSTITGTVVGAGAELELDRSGGVGTLSGLGTSFTGFGFVQVDNSAQWTSTGSNSVASGGTLFVALNGTLSLSGQLSNAGLVEEGGGSGGLDLLGGSQLVNQAHAALLFLGDGTPNGSTSSVIENDGTIVKVSGLSGGGTTISSNIVNNGTISAETGNLFLTGTISGTGLLTIGPNDGYLRLSGAVGPGQKTILFAAGGAVANASLAGVGAGQDQVAPNGAGTLDIADPAGFGTGVGTDAYSGPTIEGFALGDVIELDGIGSGASLDYDPTTGLMQIGSGTEDATLAFQPGSFAGEKFAPVTGTGGFAFTLACFAAGTRLATQGGDVSVEMLRAGDFVLTHDGAAEKVVWVGHRRINCRLHAAPQCVWPIRVRAGAFGAGVPHRDVRLSPDHAVLVDGDLIPIRYLENGRTIAQQPCAAITYFHVELARHAVLLAEGLPAESYLDTGNRSAFANSGSVGSLVLS